MPLAWARKRLGRGQADWLPGSQAQGSGWFLNQAIRGGSGNDRNPEAQPVQRSYLDCGCWLPLPLAIKAAGL